MERCHVTYGWASENVMLAQKELVYATRRKNAHPQQNLVGFCEENVILTERDDKKKTVMVCTVTPEPRVLEWKGGL